MAKTSKLVVVITALGGAVILMGLLVGSLFRAFLSMDYYERGIDSLEHGYYDLAIDRLSDAIAMDPNGFWTYYHRGVAFYYLGRYDEAIADFTKALSRGNEYRALVTRGKCYAESGRYDEALLDYTEAIRLNPEHAVSAHNERGSLHETRGNYEQAAHDYREAIRLDPIPWFYPQLDPCNNLAWLLATCPQARIRDGAEGIKYATKACEAAGWTSPAYLETLAAAYAENGQFDEAVQWQTKAVDLLQPGDVAAKEALARLNLYREGKPYRQVRGEGKE
jgi:tetratricopeptide (TPR) repeat protein